jgi:uncharacterized protein GlcG (DUF336 family)
VALTTLHAATVLATALFLVLAGVSQATMAGVADGPAALPSLKEMTADLAVEAAVQAERACAAQGYAVSVSVVDRAGALKAMVAGDGSSSLKTEASRRKAYTAAIFGETTGEVAASVPRAGEVLGALDGDLFVEAGGAPIRIRDDLIGAVGVAGAPGGDKDEACAVAAIRRVQADFR